MNKSWDAYLAPPTDFAGADDIITNLAIEREPGIEIIERSPSSLNITSFLRNFLRTDLLAYFWRVTIIIRTELPLLVGCTVPQLHL